MPNNLVLNEQIDYAELFTLWCEYWVIENRYVVMKFVHTYFIATPINIYDMCGHSHFMTLYSPIVIIINYSAP